MANPTRQGYEGNPAPCIRAAVQASHRIIRPYGLHRSDAVYLILTDLKGLDLRAADLLEGDDVLAVEVETLDLHTTRTARKAM
jgi:hypothetical protein